MTWRRFTALLGGLSPGSRTSLALRQDKGRANGQQARRLDKAAASAHFATIR